MPLAEWPFRSRALADPDYLMEQMEREVKLTIFKESFTSIGVSILVAALLTTTASGQTNSDACGSLDNAYGPFDYQTQRSKLDIVDKFHFTPEVEALAKGNTGSLGGDLDYTLRASPNHHRALIALLKLSQRSTSPQPFGLPRPIECYFERALRFQPEDPVARMIYARYLANQKRRDEASRQLATVVSLGDGNALTHYNAGLIYVELKDYAHALEEAHKARQLGLTATGLQNQLEAAGQWSAPASIATPAAPQTR